jgi:hypothetical protein
MMPSICEHVLKTNICTYITCSYVVEDGGGRTSACIAQSKTEQGYIILDRITRINSELMGLPADNYCFVRLVFILTYGAGIFQGPL